MNRLLARDSAVYSAGILLTRALGFLLIPLYTRYLPVSDYGALSLLVLLLQGISFVCLLGMSSAAVRLYFAPDADSGSRREVYGNALLFALIFPCIALLCTAPLAWRLVTSYLPAIPFFPYVVMVLLMGLFTPAIDLMSGLLTAQRRPGTYVAFHLGYFSLQSIAIVVAVAGFGYGLKGQVSSQLLTSATFGTLAIVILTRYARPRFSSSVMRQLLTFGVPLVPFFVASWIDTGAGRFAIERYLDLSQVGIFAIAAQFAGLLPLTATSLDQAMLPHFLRTATDPNASHTLGTLVARYLSLFGILALGIAILSTPVILLATTPAYYDAITYVGPLIVANLLYVARTPIMWSLSHSHRTGVLSIINIGSTIVLLLLLILLLGHFQLGVVSVAYAMIGANLLALVAGAILAQQSFRLRLPWGALLRIAVILMAGTLLIGQLTTSQLDPFKTAVQLVLFVPIAVGVWTMLSLGNPIRLLGRRR